MMSAALAYNLAEIANHFQIDGQFLDAEPYGSGHINETYASRFKTAQGIQRYIHQRINHQVFKQPAQVMDNVDRVTRHIRQQVISTGGNPARQCLTLIPTLQGLSYCQVSDGSYWRTYNMIGGAQTYDVPEHLGQVYAAAKAFGEFQHQLASLPGKRLHETIPNFHHTPRRLQAFIRAVESDPCNRCFDVKAEIDFILQRSNDAVVVVDLMARGLIPERVTHNDTKLNNVLIDDLSGEGICVIDLDTVMPGSVLYDFGDMVRSGAATAAEDEINTERAGLDLGLFERLAQGYAETGRKFLTPTEWDNLAFAGKLITFEQAIRFLGDYINGDVYYKIHHPGHNLERARTQIKMVADMERHMEDMEITINKLKMTF